MTDPSDERPSTPAFAFPTPKVDGIKRMFVGDWYGLYRMAYVPFVVRWGLRTRKIIGRTNPRVGMDVERYGLPNCWGR